MALQLEVDTRLNLSELQDQNIKQSVRSVLLGFFVIPEQAAVFGGPDFSFFCYLSESKNTKITCYQNQIHPVLLEAAEKRIFVSLQKSDGLKMSPMTD